MGAFGGVLSTEDYRHVLESELEKRKSRNPRYSMRAFARDIGIRSNRLSEILNRKQGLSPAFAETIAPKLGLRSIEAKFFLDLVTMAHGRRRADRMAAARRLSEFQKSKHYADIDLQQFNHISSWYPLAILELSKVEGFQATSEWVANRLGISVALVEEALQSLEAAGLLQREAGAWKFNHQDNLVPGGVESDSIKKYHQEILQKAMSSLKEQPVDKREYTALTVAVDPTQLPVVKERIRQFWESLDKELGSGGKRTDVYCLGLQFFSITKGEQNG